LCATGTDKPAADPAAARSRPGARSHVLAAPAILAAARHSGSARFIATIRALVGIFRPPNARRLLLHVCAPELIARIRLTDFSLDNCRL
jgi:hypothetical protein